jgi:hypothetical protein
LSRKDVLVERAALEAMPPELFEPLVRSAQERGLLSRHFQIVWRRAPSAAATAIGEELDARQAARADVLRALLELTPEDQVPLALDELNRAGRLFGVGPSALSVVLCALSNWSSARTSGWRAAYASLRQLERERRNNA